MTGRCLSCAARKWESVTIDVGTALIASGYAFAAVSKTGAPVNPNYLVTELVAKNARQGLWAGAFTHPVQMLLAGTSAIVRSSVHAIANAAGFAFTATNMLSSSSKVRSSIMPPKTWLSRFASRPEAKDNSSIVMSSCVHALTDVLKDSQIEILVPHPAPVKPFLKHAFVSRLKQRRNLEDSADAPRAAMPSHAKCPLHAFALGRWLR